MKTLSLLRSSRSRSWESTLRKSAAQVVQIQRLSEAHADPRGSSKRAFRVWVFLLIMAISNAAVAAAAAVTNPDPSSAGSLQQSTPDGLAQKDWRAIRSFLPSDYIKASNTGTGDSFGSVAIDGDTVVVGAPGEASSAVGVNGNQADDSAADSGAVYVFVRAGGVWSQQAYLKASNTEAGDLFGIDVAISGDTIVVGAYSEDSNATGVNGNQTNNLASRSGAAYVFTRTAGVWTQQAYLKASNTGAGDLFGYSVAINGNTIVVGSYFEDSNATGVNGNQADNSATAAGAAYVFTRTAGVWTQQAYLKASNTEANDGFGWSVAAGVDTIVVGAPFEDSNATGVNGDQSNNSTEGAGAAYVYTRTAGVWSQQAYLKASNTELDDSFGRLVAIDADTIVVGAPFEDSNATGVNGDQTNNSVADSGAAYVYTRTSGAWSQQAYLKASNPGVDDRFSRAAPIRGDTIVVGGWLEDSNATGVNGDPANDLATDSGAAYVYTRAAGVWSLRAYLKASNTGVGDRFGWAVAIGGETVVVGAFGEDSNATGVNGNQADNSALDAGAVYLFNRNDVAPTVTTPTSAAVTNNSATLGGNVIDDGGAAITARGVVYAATASNNDPLIGGFGVVNLPTSGSTGVFTVNASGLAAGTNYSFKAYATNSLGTSYTSVAAFSTLDPCAAISFPYTLPNNLPGTLIQAIQCANANGTADVIDLNGQTVTLTASFANYSGATGLPQITSAMTVRNGTITRTGVNEFRFFSVSNTGNLTVRDMTLTNGGGTTFANNGGSILSQGTVSTLNVVNTTISGSRVGDVQNGSGIYSNAIFTITNSRVMGNGNGRGAIASINGPVLIQNTLVAGNVASDTINSGGGIYVGNAPNVVIVNSTITGNYIGTSLATQPAGILASGGTINLTIRNSIVWGNSNNGNTSPQVVNTTAGTTTVTNSIIQGGLFGALNSDPLFVTPLTASSTPSTAGNFALQGNSPAIDAGANANVPADTFDIDGDSNTTEDAPDLAGNPRRYNDTGVADTGSGTAPIVDLGVFERQTNSVNPCAAVTFPYTLPSNLPATLIRAIECANANGTADVIDFNGQTVTLTASFADYSGATGLPQVTTDITLRNGTITRSGSNEFRLLSAANAATLRLTDLTLSNGGGATYASQGGGLSTQGSLFLTRATMSGHRSTGAGGAIAIPSLQSGATVSILDSTLSGNTAQGGGAISFTPGVSGTVSLSGSTLATNVGTGGPGAIFISGTGASITVRNSTFSANSSSNTASPDAIGVFSAAQASIGFSTFSGHDNGSGASTVGIIHAAGGASVNLQASVIANNVRTGGGSARECTSSSATFTGNTNYTADSLCPGRVAAPLFMSTTLADNGGPTQTHLPAPHSNVVNADSGNLCAPANLNLSVDQRGQPRPRGPACDVGAVEIDACGSITFPYTLPDNTPATLNAAIDCANSTAAIADVIDLNGQTVTLTQAVENVVGQTGVVPVRSPITLRNGTITRSGSNQFRLLNVDITGNLTLRDMTLSNGGGSTYGDGGSLVLASSGSTLTILRSTLTGATGSAGSSGGAIFASGALNLINSTLSGNTGGRGGAIAAQNGPIVIANSVISGNVATNTTSNGGGALFLVSINANDVRIVNSTITGNYATGSNRPGGIAGDATSGVDLILQNSIVWGNGNAGTAAPQIINAAANSTNTVTNSLIQGGLFGALDSDPLFVTPLTASATPSTAGNFQLGSFSPAIDAGANANVPADAFDVNGNSNTTENAPDRAGNVRRVDDTGVTDTGTGTAPIVDLGAFEKQTNSSLPQLTLTKTASAASFTVGMPASFTLQLSNTGTAATTAASSISDPIPAGLAIGTLPSGCTAAGQTVTCTVPAGLAAGGSSSFVIPVTPGVSSAASITNTATVSGGGDAGCPAAARCSSAVTVAVNRPQLTLTKTASAASFTVGTPANFTLQLSNTGTAATTAASSISDPIPAGLVIGTLPSGCSAAGQTVTCTVPAGLAAGGSSSFVIPVTPGVSTAASITNTATVSGGGDATCPAAARCSSAVTVAVTGTCASFTFPYTLAGADNTARVANLRQAIQCANLNGTADVIDLNAQTVTLSDSFASYIGATGLPEVSTTLTVRNGTLTRSGPTEFRIWFVNAAGNLTLDNVVVTNGVGQAPGAVGGGGAVYTLGALNLVGSRFSSNSSLLDGGAIHVEGGAVNARNTIFSGNFTNIAGGGVGGAIANTGGIVTLTNVLISGNRAVQGAGMYNNNAGILTLNHVTITGNATNDQGAGLRNENTAASAVLNNTLISGNESSVFPALSNVSGAATSNSSLVGGSPAFVAPLDASDTAPTTLGDYRLGNLSPAVDAGDNSLALLAVDLDGNPRRYDDTGVTDTGSGTAPITDIGAFEKQTNSIPLQADLSITKTDGQTAAIPGTPISYTIVASNAGPSSVANATVADTFPATITGVSWTCVGAGGGSCPASGSGNLNATVALPVGGSVTFTATGTILASATGTLINTATVSSAISDPNVGNNSATDSTTLTPQADLAITKTDGQTSAIPGTPISYTIVASNVGPSSVASATVADTFPATITGVSWTCVGAGGGTCPASGSGNLNATVGLPAGGSVTFTATGTISASATGTLSNTATVSSAVTDPNAGNNSATDVNALSALPQLSISDVSASEGNSGTTQFDFTVSLSSPALAGGVSFDIATSNNTATAGSDYQSRSLTGQTIAQGQSSYTFSVQVNGDATQEPNETFFVNVTNVTGAGVLDGQGQGTIQNDDIAGITVNPTAGLTTSEAGGTASFTVVLSAQPTADVSIGLSSSDTTEGTVAPASLTFTTANWNTPRTVTVTGVDDPMVDGTVAYTIVTATSTSTDSAFAGINPSDVAVSNTDNDVAGVTVTQSGGSTAVTEGGTTDTYTLVLTSEPTSNVVITLASGTQLTATPSPLTFTAANWNTPQTVTVTAVDDAIAEGTHSGSIGHAATSTDANYNGITVAGVTATITDNDNPGITVTQSGGSTAVTEGGATDTYTLVLTSQPTANVVIALSGGGQLTATPSPVTFTPANWNVAQTVTVTAVDDAIAEGTHNGSVTHTVTSADAAYNGRLVDSVSATITDNDVAGVTVTQSGGTTTATEGGATDTVSVVLTSQPLANVTVTVTPNAQLTASPSPLTFTSANWNVAQDVTVTAANDAVVEGNHSGTLDFGVASTDPGYGSITLPTITAAVTDNDTATVQFAPTSVSQSEATSPMAFTVTLSAPVASGVIVKVNSADGTATAGADYTAVADQTLTFAANSTTAQTVNVAVSNDALDEDNETYTLTLSGINATGDVTLGTATATGTIEDDDALPVLSVANVTQPEGNAVNTLTFTVNLSPVSGRAVSFTRATVDGTAVSTGPNADFVAIAAGPITIPAGQTSLTIPVTINGDATFEGDEQFTLSLTGVTNATPGTLSATATLTEDDQQPTTTTITADLPDPSVVGQGYPVTVEVRAQTLSPLGEVTISDGTGASCTAPLTTGAAPVSSMSCTLTSTSAGTKTLTATYTPASSAFGESSDIEAHTVNAAATSLVLLGPARARIGTVASYTAELSVTAPGSGTPAGVVTVSAGSNNCTITLPTATPSCTITYSTLGSRTVTAVFAPSNGDYAASTSNPVQTLVFASSDVSVTKTNAVNTYRPGDLLVYTVVVRNSGPDAAPQVRVRDVAPAGLTNVAWTCEASGGAVCPDSGGTGTLDHVVATLPTGGTLTYAYFGNVTGRPAQIVNVAEVTLPADTTIEDPNLANNSATDTDLLDDLFADGFEAPGINAQSGGVRLAGASLRSTGDAVARVSVRLSDVRGEALRVYSRVIGGELQVALAVRGADGSLRLGSWQRVSGEPELTWTATPAAGGWVLSGAELR